MKVVIVVFFYADNKEKLNRNFVLLALRVSSLKSRSELSQKTDMVPAARTPSC